MRAMLKGTPIRLLDKLASVDQGETEKLDRAGSPTGIDRWKRRSTGALTVITAILGFVGVAVGLIALLK